MTMYERDKFGQAHRVKDVKIDLVLFLMAIVFSVGITFGYAWRMWQTSDELISLTNHNTQLIQSLNNCEQTLREWRE